VAISGIGKVAAATAAAFLVERVEAAILVGTSGGLGAGVDPGHVVVATSLIQHDLDPRPLFPRYTQPDLRMARFTPDPIVTQAVGAAADQVVADGLPDNDLGLGPPERHDGLVASGDAFVNSWGSSRRLRQELPDVLACDMESAALAQVCVAAGLPFGIVRTISDRANGQAMVDFAKFLALAAPLHLHLVTGVLSRLG